MNEKNYYSILGVDKNASKDEIKKQFRTLSLKWHPDRFAGKSDKEKKEAEEKFKAISEAYTVLSDDKKRQEYDMGGQNPFGNGGFDPFGGGFNPFDDDFNPFRSSRRRVVKGEDTMTTVRITLEDVLKGSKKEVEYTNKKQCSHCHGTGSEDGTIDTCPHCGGTGMIQKRSSNGGMTFIQQSPCPHCGGTGKVIKHKCKHCYGSGFETVKDKTIIDIPAGIFDGANLCMEGLGGSPIGGEGINGDLYINIRILPHPKFTREDSNLIYKLEIPFTEALVGTSKDIICLDGSKINIKVPELSKDGSLLRVRGKGLPNLQSYGIGDLLIKVTYMMPKKLNNEQIELLNKFNKIEESK